jgi:Thiol:disulfide interchange protein
MEEQNQTDRIMLARRRHGIVTKMISRWQECGVIDQQTGMRLTSSIGVSPFDWKRTARYAFIIAICCLVIALGAALADRVLMDMLQHIFDIFEYIFEVPAIAKCGFFAIVSAGIFSFGLFLRKKNPRRIYSNEAVFFLGVLALAAAVAFLGVAFDTGTGHFSVLFLIASVLYALLGLWFPSALVWVFGLLSLGVWMGAETGYMSGYGTYWLGMNYPIRFALFGVVLTGIGIAGQQAVRRDEAAMFTKRLFAMSPQTKVIGLLYLFIALWIMSIFGNYDDMNSWYRSRQYELLHWALLFGVASVAAIWYGLKQDDGVLRGFGLTFLFINLYTRYFEYFWDSMHKAIFFAVLAVSFWCIGRRAETIWQFAIRRPQSGTDAQPTSCDEPA